MSATIPHYLLFSECRANSQANGRSSRSAAAEWRFVLESASGSGRFEAADVEPDMDRSRLELLSVVRGLEALAQPSRVTLITPSRYVNRGLRFGLEQWREAGWRWERYGELEPVRNEDLWRRLDRALCIHRVECRVWRFDSPHEETAAATDAGREPAAPRRKLAKRRVAAEPVPGLAVRCARLVRNLLHRCTARRKPSHGTRAA